MWKISPKHMGPNKIVSNHLPTHSTSWVLRKDTAAPIHFHVSSVPHYSSLKGMPVSVIMHPLFHF